MTIHLGCLLPDTSCDTPGRQPENRLDRRTGPPPLFGLAPGGVYRAVPVTGNAVRSYRTLSPLPRKTRSKTNNAGGLLSVALSLGSPPPGITRHRVSVEPGLSSTHLRGPRPSSHLTSGLLYAGRPRQSRMSIGRERYFGRAAITEANMLRVSRSAIPSTLDGLKWRWKAATTTVVGAPNDPETSIS